MDKVQTDLPIASPSSAGEKRLVDALALFEPDYEVHSDLAAGPFALQDEDEPSAE